MPCLYYLCSRNPNMDTSTQNAFKYCDSRYKYSRYLTREVRIGAVPMGGSNPIRIQSMTTTDTMDTIGTVEQSIRMFEAGSEYVRITAPSKKEAQNLAEIKKELLKRGYDIPLIADIHFTPNAAEIAARIVEKVRVNPGNYADKKKFEFIEYSDASYEEELERIRKRFEPLVKICKEEGTAMRIGTNHGSLSDRIMSRYGDTPIGMVESALEFVRMCEALNYHELVLSMKASNPQVMVQAYRLLVNRMEEEQMNYPLHLGVTEAGDGVDGRIKSAIGIGALLEDGLGDTVRVSLTEAPEAECPVAIDLVDRYKNRSGHESIPPLEKEVIDPFSYRKRKSEAVLRIGGDQVPVVITDLRDSKEVLRDPAALKAIGYDYEEALDKWHIAEQAADFILLNQDQLPYEIPGTLQIVCPADKKTQAGQGFPIFDLESFLNGEVNAALNFVRISAEQLEQLAALESYKNVVWILETDNAHGMAEQRRMLEEIVSLGRKEPVVLHREYKQLTDDQFTLYAATDCGALLIDGLGDGVFLSSEQSSADINETAFGILQATRTRISKTEYISCPSCGRTLFDLEETTAMIRSRTNHLKGVKIGIMGCIVNGPGEMADADYGYVGSGVGKITLYRGQEVVKRNISSEYAVDELIDIIRSDGNWIIPVGNV